MDHDAYLRMAATEDRHWWFRGRRKVLEATLRRLALPPAARILELGSGTGGNFEMLSRFGGVTAVELNETAREISLSKTALVKDVRAGILPDQAGLGDAVFDLICLFDVLEHVAEDEATLALIRRHLAPGGYTVLTVPAFRFLWGPHDVALHHKRRYEKAELRGKLQAAGFTILQLTFANMALFPAALLARLIDRAISRKRSGGDTIPPALLNEVFAALFGAERHVLGWTNLPFGLSLLAVVRAAP